MTLNRREFLNSIAGGAAVIAGWALIPGGGNLPLSADCSDNLFCPNLVRQAVFRQTANGGEVMLTTPQGLPQVVCEVNQCGSTIIKYLNGKNTLQSLAKKVHAGFDPKYLEHTQASVASFLALLAQAGVLSEPFFVNIHASEFTI